MKLMFPNRQTLEYHFEGLKKGRMNQTQYVAAIDLLSTGKINVSLARCIVTMKSAGTAAAKC